MKVYIYMMNDTTLEVTGLWFLLFFAKLPHYTYLFGLERFEISMLSFTQEFAVLLIFIRFNTLYRKCYSYVWWFIFPFSPWPPRFVENIFRAGLSSFLRLYLSLSNVMVSILHKISYYYSFPAFFYATKIKIFAQLRIFDQKQYVWLYKLAPIEKYFL